MKLNALGFDAGTEDGVYGGASDAAVREFQRNAGLAPDGIVGRETVDAILRLGPRILPGSKAQLRERLEREQGGLEGRLVYLDPGHGGRDAGVITTPGIPEAYLVYRVAEVAAVELESMGARPVMSRAVQQGPDVERRAQEANRSGADAAVSFHLACRPEPGPSVAFYRGEWTHSSMGHELALAVSETLRPHLGRATSVLGRNLPFLRETGMPAIVLDLASPGAEPLVGEDPYLAGLGLAVAHGVREYFS
jgi:N-acetylmuramoyl-L-alanine amidase